MQSLERIARLDRDQRQIAAHLGIEIEDPSRGVPEEVLDLACAGDRLGAAMRPLKLTGADIHEAQRIRERTLGRDAAACSVVPG